jgi:FMN phosphatase YigB (HAD superfamily)
MTASKAQPASRKVEVVSFDYWNTLVHESFPGALVAARLPAIRHELAAAELSVSIDVLAAAHAVAQAEFEIVSSQGTIYDTTHAATRMSAELGLPADAVELIQYGFDVGSADADVSIVPEVPESLERLRSAGLRMAIVCDVGLTPSDVLMGWLDRRGLASYFSAAAFSDRIGEYKPGPAMFEHVMHELNVDDPKCVIHIGDRRRTDVAGARMSGLRSARYSGVFDDRADLPEADLVVSSMSAFVDAVLAD